MQQERGGGSGGWEQRWASLHGVSVSALREIHDVVRDVRSRLSEMRLLPMLPGGGRGGGDFAEDQAELAAETDAESRGLLHCLLFGGCFPNVFLGKPPRESAASGLADHDLSADTVSVPSVAAVDVVGAPYNATKDSIVDAVLEGWGHKMLPNAASGHHRGGGGGERLGDWTCPQCRANVFASKTECFKCHARKPGQRESVSDCYLVHLVVCRVCEVVVGGGGSTSW
jgi:hypothetical protein